jgi:hypothetical protein
MKNEKLDNYGKAIEFMSACRIAVYSDLKKQLKNGNVEMICSVLSIPRASFYRKLNGQKFNYLELLSIFRCLSEQTFLLKK